MSESDIPGPESPASNEEAKKNALLFGVWDVSEMRYIDPNMSRYIKTTPTAHAMGRHVSKQFQKSEISIIERLINRLMWTEDNMGRKQKTNKIARDTLETVNERTEENPVQVLIRAIENAGPHKETIRLKYSGISVPQAVDVAPQHRIDEALKFIAQGALSSSYRATTTATEALTQRLIGTVDYDVQTYAISQKGEKERVAEAAR